MTAAAAPPSPLDQSSVSIAKCVGSIQTQPGCSGAKSTHVSDSETKSDRAHIPNSANTNRVDHVPIIGHAPTHKRVLQKFRNKRCMLRLQHRRAYKTGPVHAPGAYKTEAVHASGAFSQRPTYARAQAWLKHFPYGCVSAGGTHISNAILSSARRRINGARPPFPAGRMQDEGATVKTGRMQDVRAKHAPHTRTNHVQHARAASKAKCMHHACVSSEAECTDDAHALSPDFQADTPFLPAPESGSSSGHVHLLHERA